MHQMFAPRDLAKQTLFVASATGNIGHSGRLLSASAKCEAHFSLVPCALSFILFFLGQNCDKLYGLETET